MKDMELHLETLRQQIVKCEEIRISAEEPAKRELFGKLAEHYRILANEVERAIGSVVDPLTFPHKTYEPFPKQDDE